MFRNIWDYFHFYGPMIVAGVLLFFKLYTLFAIWCLFPFLWEVWDQKKPKANTPEAEKIPKWLHWCLVADGFDEYDMFLGYKGIAISFITWAILYYGLGVI